MERAGWSAGQVFLATLLAGGAGSVVDLPWRYSLTLAVSAFVVSLLAATDPPGGGSVSDGQPGVVLGETGGPGPASGDPA